MIEARNIEVQLGRRAVLSNISFSALAGAVTAIVGPNGSGKSTLLRTLSGDVSYQGSVALNGRALEALKPLEAAVMRAVLPQATVLSFPFTVREVVGLGVIGGRSGLTPRLQKDLPERALARVDLQGLAGRLYQELSGGEQQRVQLARVLCQVWVPVLDGQPRWLLLDEPVSSLDIRHQLLVLDIAREFAAAGGGVVAILHDLNLTALYADKVYVLSEGRVAASGTAAEVLTDDMLSDVFGCRLRVGALPSPGIPFILPQTARSTARNAITRRLAG